MKPIRVTRKGCKNIGRILVDEVWVLIKLDPSKPCTYVTPKYRLAHNDIKGFRYETDKPYFNHFSKGLNALLNKPVIKTK